jgi:hypothetical protein
MSKQSFGFTLKRAAASCCPLLVALAVAPRGALAQARALPPPTSVEYAQYGVALHTQTLLDGGAVCPDGATTPCIVGSGGGLALLIGYRSRGPLYLGAGFQLSRLNSSNLLRLAILQQLTADGRYYLDRGERLTPYFQLSLGGALYGNEFGASTAGVSSGIAAAVEYQLTATTVLALKPTYQVVALRRWIDATGQLRADGPLGFGPSHWLAVQLVIEARDPLSRW